MRWAAFLQIDWMYVFQDKSLLNVKPRREMALHVLLEEVVGHLQVTLNIVFFESRMKNTLFFGGVEK